MNDGIFKVTGSWQPISLNGDDITNGTFTITSLGGGRVQLLKSDTPPDQSSSAPTILRNVEDSAKYDLSLYQKLYTKSLQGNANIGIVPA